MITMDDPTHVTLLEKDLDGETNFGVVFGSPGSVTTPFGSFIRATAVRTELKIFGPHCGYTLCQDVKAGLALNFCHVKRILVSHVEKFSGEHVLIVVVVF